MQSALARLAATIDPSIVLGVVKKEFEAWKGRATSATTAPGSSIAAKTCARSSSPMINVIRPMLYS